MNELGLRMLGYYRYYRVWLENSLSHYEGVYHCRGGSEQRNRLWSVTTHMEVTSRYVKDNWRVKILCSRWLYPFLKLV